MAVVSKATIRWQAVAGATEGYEIKKDGVVVGKRGPKARTTEVLVDEKTVVVVTDLPKRSLEQVVDFAQEQGS
jgi:hypothetical protein